MKILNDYRLWMLVALVVLMIRVFAVEARLRLIERTIAEWPDTHRLSAGPGEEAR